MTEKSFQWHSVLWNHLIDVWWFGNHTEFNIFSSSVFLHLHRWNRQRQIFCQVKSDSLFIVGTLIDKERMKGPFFFILHSFSRKWQKQRVTPLEETEVPVLDKKIMGKKRFRFLVVLLTMFYPTSKENKSYFA